MKIVVVIVTRVVHLKNGSIIKAQDIQTNKNKNIGNLKPEAYKSCGILFIITVD